MDHHKARWLPYGCSLLNEDDNPAELSRISFGKINHRVRFTHDRTLPQIAPVMRMHQELDTQMHFQK